jgi:hypothetical protein
MTGMLKGKGERNYEAYEVMVMTTRFDWTGWIDG